MTSSSIHSSYYNHVFLKRSYNSKTMFGILELSTKNSQCILRMYEISTKEIVDIPIESPVHSSTYSIGFLDKLIDEFTKKYNIVQEKLQITEDQQFRLPALINWLDMGSEKIYLVYVKVSNEKPWILTSSYPYINKKDKRIRIGFLIVLPQSFAQSIKSICLNNHKKSLTIEFGLKAFLDRGWENE